MTLREQILVRIDETPYRPPNFADLFRDCGQSGDLLNTLKMMVNEREIDAENGTDGLTYRHAKPAYVEPPKSTPAPQHESIAPWPSRSKKI